MIEGQVGKICFSRLFENEDLAQAVKERVEESEIRTGVFMLIGSLRKAILGYYKEGEYKSIELEGPLEIASCMGNIAVNDKGETVIHPHIVVSTEKAEAFGGHLMTGSLVGATAELVIIEGKGLRLERTLDERTKLNLWKLG